MNKKRRRAVFLLIGLLLAVGLVVIGAVASVFAYRQFFESEDSSISLSLPEQMRLQDRSQNKVGVLVLNVDEEGPAAFAGLQRGTIILQFDGVDVNTAAELRDAIRQHETGEVVTLTILNGEESEEIEVTLESAGPYLGVTVGDNPSRFSGEQFEAVPDLPPNALPPGIPDVLPHNPRQILGPIIILQLEPDGPAEAAGLEPGDILTELDGQTIKSRANFVEQVGSTGPGDTIVLTVRRGSDTLTKSITLAAHPDDPERGYIGIHIGSTALDRGFFGEPGFRGDSFEDFSDQQTG
jgi:S1-C subfamily serine protease